METSLIITSMSAHSPPLDTCLMERLKKNNPQTVLIGAKLLFPGWENVTLKGFVQPAWFSGILGMHMAGGRNASMGGVQARRGWAQEDAGGKVWG